MLDKKEFKEIRKELENFDRNREKVISISREIIQISKQIIYCVHRGDNSGAQELISSIKKRLKDLPDQKFDTNMDIVAKQEYVEAVCFFEFVKNNKIPSRKELDVDIDSYLLGLCDLTGELVRFAVNDVIKYKDKGLVYKVKELVESIYGEFLSFNLRNGELRKKFDSIKWNLKKLEDIIYDLELKK